MEKKIERYMKNVDPRDLILLEAKDCCYPTADELKFMLDSLEAIIRHDIRRIIVYVFRTLFREACHNNNTIFNPLVDQLNFWLDGLKNVKDPDCINGAINPALNWSSSQKLINLVEAQGYLVKYISTIHPVRVTMNERPEENWERLIQLAIEYIHYMMEDALQSIESDVEAMLYCFQMDAEERFADLYLDGGPLSSKLSYSVNNYGLTDDDEDDDDEDDD
jgi:hypothetical protein